MKFFQLSFVAGGFLASCITAPSGSSRSVTYKPVSPYQFESSPFMRDYTYKTPDSSYSEANANGAYGKVNQSRDASGTGTWYIEEQRYGADAVAMGVAHDRADVVQRGVKILDWGWQQQKQDGSFDCPDNIHSTMFFVEAVARAGLVLEASPMQNDFAANLNAWQPKLRQAAAWLMQDDIERKGIERDAPYAHRSYRNAAALLQAGVWLRDDAMIERSKLYLRIAFTQQDPSGFNREKGGYDSSYHGVGLLYAARYMALSTDAQINEQLKAAAERGLAWMRSRINEQGQISAEGNTRTGSDQEVSRSGKPKDISYSYSFKAFNYWGMLLEDETLITTAKLLHAAAQRS